MNLDWSVVWDHRQQFLDGALMTILLTILTMSLALPGGMVLALLRLSPLRPLRLFATTFV